MPPSSSGHQEFSRRNPETFRDLDLGRRKKTGPDTEKKSWKSSFGEAMAQTQNDGIGGLIVGFAFGVILFHRAFKAHKRLRHIEDTPRSKVASAAQGMVELQGFAWPQTETIKTLNDKDAVYYEFKLQREESRGSGKNRRKVWVTILTKSHKPDLLLVDPTGTALIKSATAEMEMLKSQTRNWRRLSVKEKNYVSTNFVGDKLSGFPPSNFLGGFFGVNYQVVESFILRGSPLYASGDFRTGINGPELVKAKGLTRFCEMIFNLEARSEKNVSSLLDKDKNGKVSHTEEIEGYTFAAETALRRTEMDSLQERDFQICGVLQKSEEHKLFIAPSSETHLIGNMKYKPALFLLGGSALIAGTLTLGYMKVNEARTTGSYSEASTTSRRETTNALMSSLHHQCVQNMAAACTELLKNQDSFRLKPENITYYSNQLCRLGVQTHCR